MFSPRIIAAVLAMTSTAIAMPKADITLEAKDVATNTTCWIGNIHDPCYGHDNGCTPDGIYVTCQTSGSDNQMIWSSNCGTLPGTCHCIEGTGDSSC